MKNDPLGAQGKERDSAGGGCQWLELGISYSELGGLWGGVTPVNGKGCAVTADGGPAAPQGARGRWGGAAWVAAHGLAWGQSCSGCLDPIPSSHVPQTAAHQGPAGLFWCFRVSLPDSRAHHAGRLRSPQWLLPPGAALLAVHGHHLRCLQPHLPHFCHVSEPQLSGQGWTWLRVAGWAHPCSPLSP